MWPVEWDDCTQGKGEVTNFPAAQLTAARAKIDIAMRQASALSYSCLRLHWQLAPFDDVRVRQARSLAFDRNVLVLQRQRH
jgi:ABC-type oligopeptide transport system substrate-binding subunit